MLSVRRKSTKPFLFPLIIKTVTLIRRAWKIRDYSTQIFSLELDYLADCFYKLLHGAFHPAPCD